MHFTEISIMHYSDHTLLKKSVLYVLSNMAIDFLDSIFYRVDYVRCSYTHGK